MPQNIIPKKICIIIPAYNEEDSILKVIKEIKKVNNNFKILVVNDGSQDKTSDKAEKAGCDVLSLPFNLGIGGAVQTGLIFAKRNGFEIAVQIDADGQHDPKYLPLLLAKIPEGADMVIGSRFIKKTHYKAPFLRLLGINIFSALIKASSGRKIYDATSGFRVFGKRAIDFFSNNYPQDFPEPRSIVALLKNGYKIKEIPVEMRNRTAGVSSVKSIYKAIYFMISISIAIMFESIKRGKR